MMAKQLKPFDQRAAAYPPNSVIERSRQILVAERPAVRPSANRAPAHPAPMAHLSRAQLEASKPSGKVIHEGFLFLKLCHTLTDNNNDEI